MKSCLVIVLLILLTISCSAQDSTKIHDSWGLLLEPYLMFPNMKGVLGVGTLPDGEVDAAVGDIFDRLQSGFMLYAEADNGTWAFSSDLLYMKLKQDAEPSTAISSGSASVAETAWELAGLHTILTWLEGGIAARLLSIDADMTVVRNQIGGNTTGEEEHITQTWVDPLLVVRMHLPNSGQWLVQIRGDFGGFGIGSDMTWQIQVYGGYRFTELFQVTAGYRVLGINYEMGTDKDRFKYDINTFGPVMQLGFNL
jgi:hypothetical protein